MNPFTKLTSRAIYLPVENVDTDQIIPARFLKTIEKAGLGDNLFADWRYLTDGAPKTDFVLNQPASQGCAILVAGSNFGCGSSREHAPWALSGYGIRAIVSTSFADIFSNNALKNGLLPVTVEAWAYEKLCEQIEELPGSTLTIDLETQTITLPDGSTASFPIEPFSKTCLLHGVDELGYLLGLEEKIAAYEATQR